MHTAARKFVERSLLDYGDVTGDVVEFGSRDANGGVRDLFPHAQSYLGIDIAPGPGVDLAMDASQWRPTRAYACVVSTETFEHTMKWPQLLRLGAEALAPDGIMIITCASGKRRRHSATVPESAPAPGEYYANVQPDAFHEAAEKCNLEATIIAEENDLHAVLRRKLPPRSGIQIVGAGMWRTATVSLQKALEQLTGRPCHHMTELDLHPQQVSQWQQIVNGVRPNWAHLLQGYGSACDWPSLAFWEDLYKAYPESLVVLSVRDPEDWWQSVSRTVLLSAPTKETIKNPWDCLVVDLFEKHFIGREFNHEQAIEAYNRHNQYVREAVAFNRLIEWAPEDGWLPLCRALRQPVPDQPFPHLNTTADYRRNHYL